MTTVSVYDPAMCCATGVCGPEVDPALAQFAGDLDWLRSQGIAVRRFNLGQEPASFCEHAGVKEIVDRSGGDELPVIVVDDKVAASGRYPARAELSAMAGLSSAPATLAMTDQIKTLIAMGAAIGASCEPCFKFHYDKARKLGVPVEAMREAAQIGEGVKQASTKNIVGLAGRLLGTTEPEAAGASCCGPSASSAEPAKKSCC